MNDLHLRDRLFQFQYLQYPNKIIKKKCSSKYHFNNKHREMWGKKKKDHSDSYQDVHEEQKRKKLPLDNRAWDRIDRLCSCHLRGCVEWSRKIANPKPFHTRIEMIFVLEIPSHCHLQNTHESMIEMKKGTLLKGIQGLIDDTCRLLDNPNRFENYMHRLEILFVIREFWSVRTSRHAAAWTAVVADGGERI